MTDTATSPFSAAESQLGAFYQYEYALLLLLQSLHQEPATQVCIEGDDDITIRDGSITTAALQMKRRSGSRKNLTDRSEDLWGTLRVWCDGLQRGVFDSEVIQFHLATTAPASEGSIAALLRPGQQRDPHTALKRLEAIAAQAGSEANADAYAAFTALSHPARRALVNAVYVLDRSPDLPDLERRIQRELGFAASAVHVPSFVRDVEGRWVARVRKHLEAPAGDIIDGIEVRAWIDELREQYRRDTLPTPLQRAHPPDEFFRSAERHVFVRQLGLIELSPLEIRHAIQDFYRASEQRSRWIRDQLVHIEETDTYEEDLRDEWERKFATMVRRLQETEDPAEMIAAGVEFYEQMQDLDLRIRADCTPKFIMRGSLHRLADEPCIGWHAHWERSFPNPRGKASRG